MVGRAIWITENFLRDCEGKRRDPKQVFLNERMDMVFSWKWNKDACTFPTLLTLPLYQSVFLTK